MSPAMRDTSSISMSALSVLLICPDDKRRRGLNAAFSGPQATVSLEMSAYPAIDDLSTILNPPFDCVVIDLDANPEHALEVIENICARNTAVTVMASSARSDSDLLVRCMRAGAREFLTEPFSIASAGEALVRASVRRDELTRKNTAAGKLLVFMGANGGVGVTTLASNFAVGLARSAPVALVDLDMTLGDVSLTLGLKPQFSIHDAFENMNRLDVDFLTGLMLKHDSGTAVLCAPDQITDSQPSAAHIERLLRVAREGFTNVVVDAGSCSMETCDALFDMASTFYLVAQVSVAGLRNANRYVNRFLRRPESDKLQIVLNRYEPGNMDITEEAVQRALVRSPQWRIPADLAAAQRAQNAGVPLVREKAPIARAIADMAMAVSGHAPAPVKKKKFSLFG